MTERNCKAGEIIYYKDERAEDMAYIVSGRFRLVRLPASAVPERPRDVDPDVPRVFPERRAGKDVWIGARVVETGDRRDLRLRRPPDPLLA